MRYLQSKLCHSSDSQTWRASKVKQFVIILIYLSKNEVLKKRMRINCKLKDR